MNGHKERENNKVGLFRWRQRQSFIGDDDTDKPDFDKGSWAAFAFVIVLIGLGIAMMLALVNWS